MEIDIRRQFCEDYNCPVESIEDDDIWEKIVKILNKWNSWIKYRVMVLSFGDISSFQRERKRIFDLIVEHIRNKDSFQQLNDKVPNCFQEHVRYEKMDIKHLNSGTWFVKIDMVTASFQALRYLDPELVDNKSSWNEFASQFVTDLYQPLIESKVFRHNLLNKCNRPVQHSFERWVMDKLIKCCGQENLVYKNLDEIFLKLPDDEAERQKYLNYLNSLLSELCFHIKPWQSYKIGKWWFKRFTNKEYEFCHEIFRKNEFPSMYQVYLNLANNMNND